MPFQTGWIDRENVRPILADREGAMFLKGLEFASVYYPVDSDGYKFVTEGLVVAKNTQTGQYVPYDSAAAYGVGSDTAVGVLDDHLDLTHGNEGCTPIFHGKVMEENCFVIGGTLGSISASIKTDLPDVHWVSGS